jgi:hypothetical protein
MIFKSSRGFCYGPGYTGRQRAMPGEDNRDLLLRMTVHIVRSAMPGKLPAFARKTSKDFRRLRLKRRHRGSLVRLYRRICRAGTMNYAHVDSDSCGEGGVARIMRTK